MPTERTLVTAVLLFLSISLAAWTAPARAAEPGPQIVHKPDPYYIPGFRIDIQAEVRSESLVRPVKEVRCYFKTEGEKDFAFVEMRKVDKDLYHGTLPAPRLDTNGIEYSFSASDLWGRTSQTPTFRIREMQTDEAKEWRRLKNKVKEEARSDLEESLIKRLFERHRESLPQWQTAKAEGGLAVRTEAAQAPKDLSGFKDSVVVKGTEAAGAGISTTTAVVGGAVAVGAVAIGGGGGGGGGSTTTTTTTTTTTGGGACASTAGNWGGGFSGMDCFGMGDSGSWTINSKDDCSWTGTATTSAGPAPLSGSISGNSVSGGGTSPDCGSIGWSGTISGNSASGSYSLSSGGGGSWSGSKK